MLIDGAFAWLALLVVGPAVLFYLRRVRHLPVSHLLAVALINDVVLNTLGVLIGILGFALVRAVYRTLFARGASTPRAWERVHATLMAPGD